MTELASTLRDYFAALDVTQVELLHSERGASFRGSSVSMEASSITAAARSRHLSDGYGFWEHVVAAGITAKPDTRAGLYAGAVRHRPATETSQSMTVAEFTQTLRDGRWEQLHGREMVSLSSRATTTNGSEIHLHLLDLGLPDGPSVIEAIRAGLDTLGIDGALVSSGRSYHFYGLRISDWPEYATFLARAAFLSPLVDARWVLHQLLDRRGALRISSNHRDTHTPTPA